MSRSVAGHQLEEGIFITPWNVDDKKVFFRKNEHNKWKRQNAGRRWNSDFIFFNHIHFRIDSANWKVLSFQLLFPPTIFSLPFSGNLLLMCSRATKLCQNLIYSWIIFLCLSIFYLFKFLVEKTFQSANVDKLKFRPRWKAKQKRLSRLGKEIWVFCFSTLLMGVKFSLARDLWTQRKKSWRLHVF